MMDKADKIAVGTQKPTRPMIIAQRSILAETGSSGADPNAGGGAGKERGKWSGPAGIGGGGEDGKAPPELLNIGWKFLPGVK